MSDGNLRQLFMKNMPDMHMQAVETGGVGKGVPDVNFCHGAVEGWIENKITATNAVGMRPEQVGWIERRRRAGGRVFIAVRFKHEGGLRKGAKADVLYLFSGQDVRALYDEGLVGAQPLISAGGGPARWPWQQIRETLLYFRFLFP